MHGKKTSKFLKHIYILLPKVQKILENINSESVFRLILLADTEESQPDSN